MRLTFRRERTAGAASTWRRSGATGGPWQRRTAKGRGLNAFVLNLATWLAALTIPAAAADALLPDLERRLALGGVEKTNAHLSANWSTAMLPLNQQTAACEFQAIGLALRLSRGADAKAAPAHTDALRAAVGQCTAFVLALAAPQDVPKLCSSVASWGVMQTVRELRRRIATIEADVALRASPNGAACRAACLDELHNTRVVLKSAPTPTTPADRPPRGMSSPAEPDRLKSAPSQAARPVP